MNQSEPYGSWPHSSHSFGGSSLPGAPTWGGNMPSSLGGWGQPINNAFGNASNSTIRAGHPRSVTVRLALCKACKNLEATTPDGYIEMGIIRDQLEKILGEEPLQEKDLLEICETEGNANNGGGVFEVRTNENSINFIKHEPDMSTHRTLGAPGEIGSPIVGSGISIFGGRNAFGPPGGF